MESLADIQDYDEEFNVQNPKKCQLSLKMILGILFLIIIAIVVIIIIVILSSSSDNDEKKKDGGDDSINIIKAKYYIEESNKIKIINDPYDKLNIQIFIDEKQDPLNFVTEYKFPNLGNHSITFKFKEEITNLSSLFSSCTNLIEIDFSSVNQNFKKDVKLNVCFQKQDINLKSDQILNDDENITNKHKEKDQNKKTNISKMSEIINYFNEGEREILDDIKKKKNQKEFYQKKT